ncbi:MAG: GntR family transcriptional regulator [Clostridiaceae bacterium]
MDFKNNIPIYIQIIELIEKDIINEKIKCGEQLPSVRDMSVKYKVNPNTIQKVFKELERKDIVFTKRGMGTFVKEDCNMVEILKENMATELMGNFLKSMEELGFNDEEIVGNLKKVMDKGERNVTGN